MGADLITDQTYRMFATNARSIACGATRECFDLGDGHVLKVDYSAGGTFGDCFTEAAVWETVRDTPEARFFAPVVAHGAGWLVMVKADTDTDECDRDELADDMAREGIRVVDMHAANIGRIGDALVCIDYAAGCGEAGEVSCDGCGWCGVCEDAYAAAHECESRDARHECTRCECMTDCDECAVAGAWCDGCDGARLVNRDAVGFVTVGHFSGADNRGRVFFCDRHAPTVAPAMVELIDAGQQSLFGDRVWGYLLFDAM